VAYGHLRRTPHQDRGCVALLSELAITPNTDKDWVEVVTFLDGPKSFFGPELNGHGM
jgi:hypothetical protein